MVERCPDKTEVASSILASPTQFCAGQGTLPVPHQSETLVRDPDKTEVKGPIPIIL